MRLTPLSDLLPDVPPHLLEWCWRCGWRDQDALLEGMLKEPERWAKFLLDCPPPTDYNELVARLQERKQKGVKYR